MSEHKFVFHEWLEKLDNFYNSVQRDLKEIRQCKAEVQQIKRDVYNRINKGYYLYDDDRIVISAPEIIIGNVDKGGTLIGNSSVLIRSNNVEIEGVGESGTIQNKATTIANIAEDPGDDGKEAVVHEKSSISSIARKISLDSCKDVGIFGREACSDTVDSTGLSLHSDSSLSIDASISRNKREQQLEAKINNIEPIINGLSASVSQTKQSLANQMGKMEDILREGKVLLDSEEMANTNVVVLDDLGVRLNENASTFYQTIDSYLVDLANLAEAYRAKTELTNLMSNITERDQFNANSTGASLRINSEKIEVTSNDGDKNVRTNEASGIKVNSSKIRIGTTDSDGKLLDKSSVKIESENIALLTNSKEKKDNKITHPAKGEIRLNSKKVEITANDYDENVENPYSVKSLTKEGKIHVEAETVDLDTANERGEQVGTIGINGKSIYVETVNVQAENRKDDKCTEGGSVNILSPQINIGSTEEDIQTEELQLIAKKNGMFATESLQMAQGKDNDIGSIDIQRNSVHIKTKRRHFYGEGSYTYGKAKFFGDVELKTCTTNNLEVKNQIKTPSTTDGTALAASSADTTTRYDTPLKIRKIKKRE